MSTGVMAKPYQFFPRPFGTGGFTNPTAAGSNTGPLNIEGWEKALFVLSVTAASGTNPTLDVYIDGFDSISATWVLGAASNPPPGTLHFTQATGITSQTLVIDPVYFRVIRARWVTGGSNPSFTWTLGTHFRATSA